MYKDMLDYVKEYLSNTDLKAGKSQKLFPFRNRFEHTLRVWEWAKRINKVEKGDEEIIDIAAIFHDIGKGEEGEKPHALISAELCRKYLKSAGFNEDKIDRITSAVRRHSSKHLIADELSLEERIIMDADLLDEAGAMCVLWDSMHQGAQENASYYKTYASLQNHYEERARGIKLLKTSEGKRLYEERISFLKLFLDNLRYELGMQD